MIDLKILTFTIACLGLLIAYQQFQINSQKLKLDLFEKRYAVFDALKTIINQVTHHATINNDHINEYKINIADAKFLFNDDVNDYLQTVLNKSAALLLYQTKKELDNEHLVILWFGEELDKYQNSFMPYMSFHGWNLKKYFRRK